MVIPLLKFLKLDPIKKELLHLSEPLSTIICTFAYCTHLYKAAVRPFLEYGNVIWGPTYKIDEDLIEKVQRKATKLVDI